MKDIFCDKYVIQGFDQNRGELVLKEEGTNQSIVIGGIPIDAILIKLDIDKPNYKIRSSYFRPGQKFIHQGCDYCLILPSSNLAILFELKSSYPKGYVDQFTASELFIEYCTKLWNKLNCDNINLSFKRILLSPKYNYHFTSNKELHNLTKLDRCKTEIKVFSPGFPKKLRLEKLI